MSYQMGTTLAGTLYVLYPTFRSSLTRMGSCRDSLVAHALGETSYGGIHYSTQVQNITGLLAPGSGGVNHGACWYQSR